ncbi:tetratricopeptide repeat-containing diguanylate cyclase [Neptunicella marina]|uniref:diguanylate cyclase n=1 Tax=Neptunicella marina TaxID=2125989 RepID=A0A8J6M0T1_9ALTE|nr:GGDEF domain-containing protein [Neptunicella marina]MBC3767364.1 diguanylate cyclase [Neptunicella marina]
MTQLTPRFNEFAQQIKQQPDTVLKQLKAMDVSSLTLLQKVQWQLVLSHTYYALTYPHEALQEAQTGLTYVNKAKQPWLYHQLRLAEALAYDIVGDPAKGMEHSESAVGWAKLHNDYALQLDALYTRGVLEISLVDYSNALVDLQNARSLAPQLRSHTSEGEVSNALAQVYEYRQESELSIPFFQDAVEYHKRHNEPIDLSIALYGLGRANKNVGNLDLGKQQLQHSADISASINDIQGVAYASKELAGLNMQEGNLDLAEEQLKKAFNIFTQARNPYMQFDVTLSLAQLALKKSQPQLAEQYLQQAGNYLYPKTMPLQKISFDEEQARVKAALGDYKSAFDILEKTVQQKQKIYVEQSTERLHRLRSQYELEMKEQTNLKIQRENALQKMSLMEKEHQNQYLMVLFAFTLLICVLLAIMVYRNQINRKRLTELANIDGLTGLLNRRKTLEMLQLQFDLAQRHQFPLCIAIVDLDHFKKINDELGHPVGDKVLAAFGQLCQKTFRHTDIVGRIGGEEFMVALPHTGLSDAEGLLCTLRERAMQIGEMIDVGERTISISIGLCLLDGHKTVQSLMAQADDALYSAKQAGRNRIEIFSAANQRQAFSS